MVLREWPEDAPGPGWAQVAVGSPQDVERGLDLLRGTEAVEGVRLVPAGTADPWLLFLSLHVLVQAAGGAVTDEKGRLLAIERLGRWDLPKGKVDRGEELPDAAVREVREECGLDTVRLIAPLCATWHTYVRDDERHLKRTDWFLMEASAQEELVPQAEEDITAVAWLDAEGVARMRHGTYPGLLKVLSAWEAAVGRRRT